MEYSQSDIDLTIQNSDIEQLNEWLKLDIDRNQRIQIIKDLMNNKIQNYNCFNPLNRLEFGTAGLRGIITYGYNAMNEIVIIQTVQGLIQYLKTKFNKQQLEQINVTIAHDARLKSAEFADITAAIMIDNNIHVNYFKQLSPTPYCSYFTKYFKSQLGIMVTASHNPSMYNGYKVYTLEGVQINSPIDQQIQDCISTSIVINKKYLNYKQILQDAIDKNNQYLNILTDESQVVQQYYDEISKNLCLNYKDNQDLQVVCQYSAMFGVGYKAFMRMAQNFGFYISKIKVFNDSIIPDPYFGGLLKPNPELIQNMQRLASQADEDTQLILAGDPDHDRLAVSEKQKDGQWKHFTGCETGILLSEYMIEHSSGNNRMLISTVVSTHMIKRMAEYNNIEYAETLTGFKNMCSLALKETKQNNKKVLICFEEAIGFTENFTGIIVNDKDGVTTGNVMLQYANQLYKQGLTLQEKLNQIYNKYGFYQYISGSVQLKELSQATQLLLPFIEDANDRSYPNEICGMKVLRVRDLMYPGYDSSTKNHKPSLPLQHTEMLTFFFEKAMITLRMSGTEPLLKYYIETNESTLDDAKRELSILKAYILDQLTIQ